MPRVNMPYEGFYPPPYTAYNIMPGGGTPGYMVERGPMFNHGQMGFFQPMSGPTQHAPSGLGLHGSDQRTPHTTEAETSFPDHHRLSQEQQQQQQVLDAREGPSAPLYENAQQRAPSASGSSPTASDGGRFEKDPSSRFATATKKMIMKEVKDFLKNVPKRAKCFRWDLMTEYHRGSGSPELTPYVHDWLDRLEREVRHLARSATMMHADTDREEIILRIWKELGRTITIAQPDSLKTKLREAAQAQGSHLCLGQWSEEPTDVTPLELSFDELREALARDQPIAFEWVFSRYRAKTILLRRQPHEAIEKFADRVENLHRQMLSYNKRWLPYAQSLPPHLAALFPTPSVWTDHHAIFIFFETAGLSPSNLQNSNTHFVRYYNDLKKVAHRDPASITEDDLPSFAGIRTGFRGLTWPFFNHNINSVMEKINVDIAHPGPNISLNDTSTVVIEKMLPIMQEMIQPPRAAPTELLRRTGLPITRPPPYNRSNTQQPREEKADRERTGGGQNQQPKHILKRGEKQGHTPRASTTFVPPTFGVQQPEAVVLPAVGSSQPQGNSRGTQPPPPNGSPPPPPPTGGQVFTQGGEGRHTSTQSRLAGTNIPSSAPPQQNAVLNHSAPPFSPAGTNGPNDSRGQQGNRGGGPGRARGRSGRQPNARLGGGYGLSGGPSMLLMVPRAREQDESSDPPSLVDSLSEESDSGDEGVPPLSSLRPPPSAPTTAPLFHFPVPPSALRPVLRDPSPLIDSGSEEERRPLAPLTSAGTASDTLTSKIKPTLEETDFEGRSSDADVESDSDALSKRKRTRKVDRERSPPAKPFGRGRNAKRRAKKEKKKAEKRDQADFPLVKPTLKSLQEGNLDLRDSVETYETVTTDSGAQPSAAPQPSRLQGGNQALCSGGRHLCYSGQNQRIQREAARGLRINTVLQSESEKENEGREENESNPQGVDTSNSGRGRFAAEVFPNSILDALEQFQVTLPDTEAAEKSAGTVSVPATHSPLPEPTGPLRAEGIADETDSESRASLEGGEVDVEDVATQVQLLHVEGEHEAKRDRSVSPPRTSDMSDEESETDQRAAQRRRRGRSPVRERENRRTRRGSNSRSSSHSSSSHSSSSSSSNSSRSFVSPSRDQTKKRGKNKVQKAPKGPPERKSPTIVPSERRKRSDDSQSAPKGDTSELTERDADMRRPRMKVPTGTAVTAHQRALLRPPSLASPGTRGSVIMVTNKPCAKNAETAEGRRPHATLLPKPPRTSQSAPTGRNGKSALSADLSPDPFECASTT